MRKNINVERILRMLKDSDGLTIADLSYKTKLSRATARIALARLEGSGKVGYKKIGMAKIYTLKKRGKK